MASTTFTGPVTSRNGFVGATTGALNGTLGATTPASASVTTFSQNGARTLTAQTLAATGSTQGGAAAITGSVVIVTVTASTQGVKLPTAAAGARVEVFASRTVGNKVYPFSGDVISGAATNASITLASNKGAIFQAVDAVTWRYIKGA